MIAGYITSSGERNENPEKTTIGLSKKNNFARATHFFCTFLCRKAWFSYVGKIPDDQGFYFLPTVPDPADISDNRQKSVPDSSDIQCGGNWKVR